MHNDTFPFKDEPFDEEVAKEQERITDEYFDNMLESLREI